MDISIIRSPIKKEVLQEIAKIQFGDWVKAVVDIKRRVMAIGGDLHADEEAVLLDDGSKQQDVWGINLWLEKDKDEWVQFNSMINIRPSQDNKSRSVENISIQEDIKNIVDELIIF